MSYYVRKTKTKYNNRKHTYNGNRYDSAGEANYAKKLDLLKKAGEIKGYERQVKIPLKVNGVLITTYYADFVVTDKHGQVQVHEYKGFKTREFFLKWKLLNALKDDIFGKGGIELHLIEHRGRFANMECKK